MVKSKNDDSLILKFDQRALYSIVHPYIYDEEFPIPINFSGLNNGFYGRMDLYKDLIYPKPDKMKQITALNSAAVYVFPFVADAFDDFVSYLKIKKANKLLADDNFTTDWSAKRGWFDIEDYRVEIVKQMMDSFTGTYLTKTDKHKKIANFDSFLKIFIDDYLPNMIYDYPITKSGLIYSKYYSPMSSGLCVEISYADHGNDQIKTEQFLENPNYKVYSLAASKYGFLIDKNAPWRLVANLNSGRMKGYIKEYMYFAFDNGDTNPSINDHYHTYSMDSNGNGKTTSTIQGVIPIPEHEHVINERSVSSNAANNITNHSHIIEAKVPTDFTPQDVYDNFYTPAILEDISALKEDIIIAYTNYIIDYPSPTVPEMCAKGESPRVVLKSITRPPAVPAMISQKYPPVFWLKLFFKIRLKECKAIVSDTNISYNLKKIEVINKTVDFNAALLYAQKYLKQYY